MKKQLVTLAALAITTTALAAPSNKSVTSTKSTAQKILDKTSMGYFVDYLGAKLQDMSDTRDAAAWTQLKARYAGDNGITYFLSNAFVINQENLNADGDTQNTYVIDDFRVGLEKWSAYTKDIKFRNRIRIESPSEAEQQANRAVRLRASHLVLTTLANRHNLAGFLGWRNWFYNSEQNMDEVSRFEFLPSVSYSYKITDKLSAYTDYTFAHQHVAGENALEMKKGWSEMHFGANYSVAKALNVGAFVYYFMGSDNFVRMDQDAQLKVQLSGAIF
jgi:hypothetical protein